MATDLFLVKTHGGVWIPAGAADQEATQVLSLGQPYKVSIKECRNYRFHCKAMGLLRLMFQYWEPQHSPWFPNRHPEDVAKFGGLAQKNFDEFRGNVMVLAGFYDPVWNVRGEVRCVPHSMAFSSMSEARFREVYKGIFNVGWHYILQAVGFKSEAEIEAAAQNILRFDG